MRDPNKGIAAQRRSSLFPSSCCLSNKWICRFLQKSVQKCISKGFLTFLGRAGCGDSERDCWETLSLWRKRVWNNQAEYLSGETNGEFIKSSAGSGPYRVTKFLVTSFSLTGRLYQLGALVYSPHSWQPLTPFCSWTYTSVYTFSLLPFLFRHFLPHADLLPLLGPSRSRLVPSCL